MKTLPVVGLREEFIYKFVHGIKTVYPLNLIRYDKGEAKRFLLDNMGWKDYGGKHHESRITAYWQSYVMPKKYNMDYRRATLSAQIVHGQITRAAALEELSTSPFDLEKITRDREFIAKKFRISLGELEEYETMPPKTYKDFPNDCKKIEWYYEQYRKYVQKH